MPIKDISLSDAPGTLRYSYRVRLTEVQKELFKDHTDTRRALYNIFLAMNKELRANSDPSKILEILKITDEVAPQDYPESVKKLLFKQEEYDRTRAAFLSKGEDLSKHTLTIQHLNYYDTCGLLTIYKQQEDLAWLAGAPICVLQASLRDLDTAYRRFWDKKLASRFPRFKSRYDTRVSSLYLTRKNSKPISALLEGDKLKIPKLGTIEIVKHRELLGDFSMTTLIREADGRYHVSIPMKNTRTSVKRSIISEDEVVGLDAGIKTLLTLSDDSEVASLKHTAKYEVLIKKRQRKLSKCEKGSAGYTRARILVAKTQAKLARYRKHCLHVISSQLAKKYKAIVIEDLDIKRMMANKHLARLISNASWGMLYSFLAYKLQAAGGRLFQAGRYFASSKTCNSCGDKNHALKLKDRTWICQSCNTTHDRDKNAARNLRDLGKSFVRSVNSKIGALKIVPRQYLV